MQTSKKINNREPKFWQAIIFTLSELQKTKKSLFSILNLQLS